MRCFGRTLVPALCLLFIAADACAQVLYPSKPIRILVPYAPGGLTDVVARLYSEQLRHRLGRGVFIDNQPGAPPESSRSRRWPAPDPTATP
jgi:tripartite-type tricarboxylate transporter receptor subunit TctC